MKIIELKKFLCVVLVLLVVSAAAVGGQGDLTIRLEEVLSIGSLDDDVIFQWVGIATDSEGVIYLTDTMDYSLKAFSIEGRLIRKQGRKGQGPGEFMAPRLLEFSKGLLYVTDQNQHGIQIFDTDLSYKRRIPLVFPVVSFKMIEERLMAVVTLNVDKKGQLLFIDDKGKVKKKLQYAKEKTPLMMDMADIEVDKERNVYIAYTFQDKIEKWDRSGKRIWLKNLFRKKKVKTKKIASHVVPTNIIYKDIALDSCGRIYVLGGHFAKNSSRDIYILSPEGEHLATFTLPESSHCIHIDERDFLYSRANDGVTLKKYKIHYEFND